MRQGHIGWLEERGEKNQGSPPQWPGVEARIEGGPRGRSTENRDLKDGRKEDLKDG